MPCLKNESIRGENSPWVKVCSREKVRRGGSALRSLVESEWGGAKI